MTTTFPQRYAEVATGLQNFGSDQPEVMAGFSQMHRSATADGALSTRTKELMALAIAISARCTGCIAFHVHDALGAGADREQIAETVSIAVLMGGGPAVVYGVEAMRAVDEFSAATD